jgi:predicted amidophosphoribosyltransferase
MTDWAYRHANYSSKQLNTLRSPGQHQPIYLGSMEHMCSKDYTGPLCGACQADFGHSGSTCVQCPTKAGNAFFFIGMCLLTLLIPSVSVFMHIGEVKRRTGKLTEWKKAQQARRLHSSITGS